MEENGVAYASTNQPSEIRLPGQFPIQIISAPTAFALKLLETFSITGEREVTVNTQDFLNGSLVPSFCDSPTEAEKIQYYQYCLRVIDWSFNEKVLRSQEMIVFFAGAIEDMEAHINDSFCRGILDPEDMRDKLPLDSIPFRFARRFLSKNIQDLPKDDEIRIACQALFLFLLRPRIPLKYENMDDFLAKYPEVKERNSTEQVRLRHTANWMDLAFYTVQPRNNKTFIMNLVPRIVEGRNARYITGSGQTKPTADRVNIFRLEGNCEKIKRPPRRKKDDVLASMETDGGSIHGSNLSIKAKAEGKNGSFSNTSKLHAPLSMPMASSGQGHIPAPLHPNVMLYPMYFNNGAWAPHQSLWPGNLPNGYTLPPEQSQEGTNTSETISTKEDLPKPGYTIPMINIHRGYPSHFIHWPPPGSTGGNAPTGMYPGALSHPGYFLANPSLGQSKTTLTDKARDDAYPNSMYPFPLRMIMPPYPPNGPSMPIHAAPDTSSIQLNVSSLAELKSINSTLNLQDGSKSDLPSNLGKRKAVEDESDSGGLHLLFAAVHSIESNQI